MNTNHNDHSSPGSLNNEKIKMPLGFRELLHELLLHANQSYSRADVLRRLCSSLLRFSGSDFLCIRIDEGGRTTRCRAVVSEDGTECIETYLPQSGPREGDAGTAACDLVPEPILHAILKGSFAASGKSFTMGKSFWTGDTARPIRLHKIIDEVPTNRTVIIGGEYASLALVIIPVNDKTRGILFLASRQRDFYSKDDIQIFEVVAQTLGVALNHLGTQWALRERVKELTCLYGIKKMSSRPGILLDDFLKGTVELLPPGWQYPEITTARIILDKHSFMTEGFKESSYKQLAEIIVNDKCRGVVEIYYTQKMPEADEGPFLKEERNLINAIAETVGRQVGHHEAQWALRERVKELTCLYGIAKVASRPHILIDDFLKEVVELLPPGWQYPEITQSRIILDGRAFSSAEFSESPYRQNADILVDNHKRGEVEVVYAMARPNSDEGPFLKEERSLINEIARQVGFVVEHLETEQETSQLQEQLRHAERLATLGQLSAGVAHELNEPLAAILGFSQLAKESPVLADQTRKDIEKIINAALHAREVIRKLMIFTRQMPTRKVNCDLSNLIKEGLYFLESRCAKEGIIIVRELDNKLPQVMADPSQIHQALVNLVVNAIQSMPDGGKLTLKTRVAEGKVCFIVEDTGVGMNQEVQKQLFTPFFTTKDVGKGTGLGLSVVHGIVMAHGGKINVKSEVGRGSSFEICLPIENSSIP